VWGTVVAPLSCGNYVCVQEKETPRRGRWAWGVPARQHGGRWAGGAGKSSQVEPSEHSTCSTSGSEYQLIVSSGLLVPLLTEWVGGTG